VRKHWRYLWRVLPYARPYWKLATGSVFVTVVAAIIPLAEPWPLAFLIDGVLGGKDGGTHKPLPSFITNLVGTDPVPLIIFAVTAGLALALLGNGIAILNEYVHTKLALRMTLDFRRDLFGNALKQSKNYRDQRSHADFIARINYESSSIGNITTSLPPLAQALITLVGMAYIAYRIDPILAGIALLVVPFMYCATGYYGNHIEPKIRWVRGLEGKSLSIVMETMSMLPVVHAFTREDHEHRRFHTQAAEAVDARVKLTVRQMLFSLSVNTITAIGSALVLGVGAYHVVIHRISVGELLVVLAYVHSVYQPLEQISQTLASVQEQFIYAAMSFELLDEVPDIQERPGARAIGRSRGQVVFDDVHFSYTDRGETLKGISFEARAGESVAVVGPTGAGKTTLLSMLPRFLDPQRGAVRIDGEDVRELTLRSLREQVSVVLQEPQLFSGSVAECIRYGRLEASDEEIMEAARAANAHDFIMGLPQQYQTMLGEAGTQLSGGERQRICVARAFLKDAPILVLDEPTSSIDSRTESVILDALDDLMVGRTTFMIAHRLSTLRGINHILVIDHGALVEHGTHDELLDRRGMYWELHEIQQRQRRRREATEDSRADSIRALKDAFERARLLTETAVNFSSVNGNGNGNGNSEGEHT